MEGRLCSSHSAEPTPFLPPASLGKTTTAAMLAWALHCRPAPAEPVAAIVGANVPQVGLVPRATYAAVPPYAAPLLSSPSELTC